MHTTALPPTLNDASTNGAPNQNRRSRLFRFGNKKAEMKQVAEHDAMDNAKRGASSVDKEKNEDAVKAETRGNWLRRLSCMNCGCS